MIENKQKNNRFDANKHVESDFTKVIIGSAEIFPEQQVTSRDIEATKIEKIMKRKEFAAVESVLLICALL